MTTTNEPQEHAVEKTVDKAQYLVCAVLVAVGAIPDLRRVVPGGGFREGGSGRAADVPDRRRHRLDRAGDHLGLAIPRGSTGEEEGGEDIDTSTPADWRTVGLLVGLFIATILLVMPLGWAITGTLLFAGAATILGSKRYVLNVILGVVLAVGSFYAFYSGLGIPLPAGILDGIL